MNRAKIKVKILGSRGSVPLEGENYRIYGGATSCIRLSFERDPACLEEIYLDAGSGIVTALPETESRLSILLTHMHIDHIIGLPFFPALSQKDRRIDLYAAPRDSLEAETALARIFSPPFWPLKITDYPANVSIHDIQKSFQIGNVKIDSLEINHPGGSTSYKITYQGISLVYATDYEHCENNQELIAFARNTNLLLYDGQYSQEEFDKYRGFGHSTPEMGLEIAKAAGVKRILFIHHSPDHTDEKLASWEKEIQKKCSFASLAKINEEIIL